MDNLFLILAGAALYMAVLVMAYAVVFAGFILFRALRYKLRNSR